MSSKKVAVLAFAATCLLTAPLALAEPPAQMITNGPQADPGDHSGHWSATRNVRESREYDRLLQTSARFRHVRMRKECGPITDPRLHSNCMASFSRPAETMSGSSVPPTPIRNSSGGDY